MTTTTTTMTAQMKKKAVAVAEDVLKSVRLLNVVTHCCYLNRDDPGEALALRGSKKQAEALKKNCEVCALGACFLSLVALRNKYHFPTHWKASYFDVEATKIAERLLEVFTPEQMLLIESAFEMQTGVFGAAQDYLLSCEDEDEFDGRRRVCPFNSDNSRFLLVHQSYFGLYDGTGFYLQDLPFEINASCEPRSARQACLSTRRGRHAMRFPSSSNS